MMQGMVPKEDNYSLTNNYSNQDIIMSKGWQTFDFVELLKTESKPLLYKMSVYIKHAFKNRQDYLNAVLENIIVIIRSEHHR